MSFLPVKYNFTIWKGATFSKRLTLYTGEQGSAARDLTGYTALLEIKDKPEGAVLMTLNTANSRIVLGGATGNIDLLISATDTGTINWQGGVYDLTIQSGAGVVDAILTGGFTVRGV